MFGSSASLVSIYFIFKPHRAYLYVIVIWGLHISIKKAKSRLFVKFNTIGYLEQANLESKDIVGKGWQSLS